MTSSRRLVSISCLAVLALVVAACSSSTGDQPAPAGDGAPTPGGPTTGGGGGTEAGSPTPGVPSPTQDGGDSGSMPNGAWGPSKCAALPAGKQVGNATGDQLPKLVVKDCDGNDYALDNSCGASATWLFVAHGWCPYCRNATKNAETILASYAGKNVAAVNVLVQSAASQPPTMADCKAWRDTYKLTNVVALYDPTGVTLPLFDAGSSALGVYLDKDRIIRSKTIHTDDTTAIKAGIDGALVP